MHKLYFSYIKSPSLHSKISVLAFYCQSLATAFLSQNIVTLLSKQVLENCWEASGSRYAVNRVTIISYSPLSSPANSTITFDEKQNLSFWIQILFMTFSWVMLLYSKSFLSHTYLVLYRHNAVQQFL